MFKVLFCTFVRPHLEYAQAVWAPHLKKNINVIENVQRRATKLVDGLWNIPYPDRLERLCLPTLAFWRKVNDMVELYKNFHIYDRSSLSKAFQPQTRPSRKHNFQLVPRIPRDGVRGVQTNSFYFRTVQPWNQLSEEIVNATTVNSFKELLIRTWVERRYQ